MKVTLCYDDKGHQFGLEPETEMEQCALNYLATRPQNQVSILITRLGLFKRPDKKESEK